MKPLLAVLLITTAAHAQLAPSSGSLSGRKAISTSKKSTPPPRPVYTPAPRPAPAKPTVITPAPAVLPAQPSVPVQPPSRQVRAIPATPEGIIAEIKQRAAEKWPNDFEMQEFTIKNQTAACLELGSYLKNGLDGVPRETANTIIAEAIQKWGTDYEMNVFTIKNQAASYRKVNGR